MAKIINIVGEKSNVGKTLVATGIIKELTKRRYDVGSVKHHSHNFDLDKKGKDTYMHREAGASTVILSCDERTAILIENNKNLDYLLDILKDKDFIIVEGYKNSSLKKIEVFRSNVSSKIISKREDIICVASDVNLEINNINVINKYNFKEIVDLIIEYFN